MRVMSGTGMPTSGSNFIGVWQSLQPPMLTSCRPRATGSRSTPVGVVGAGLAAQPVMTRASAAHAACGNLPFASVMAILLRVFVFVCRLDERRENHDGSPGGPRLLNGPWPNAKNSLTGRQRRRDAERGGGESEVAVARARERAGSND